MVAALGRVNSRDPGLVPDVLSRELLQAPLLPLTLLDQLFHDQAFTHLDHDEEEDAATDDQEHRHQPELPPHGQDNDGYDLKQRR